MEIVEKKYVDMETKEIVQVIWLMGEAETICTCFRILKDHPGQQRSTVGTCLREPHDFPDTDYAMRLSLKRALWLDRDWFIGSPDFTAYRRMYDAFRNFQYQVTKGELHNETSVF